MDPKFCKSEAHPRVVNYATQLLPKSRIIGVISQTFPPPNHILYFMLGIEMLFACESLDDRDYNILNVEASCCNLGLILKTLIHV